MMSLIALFIITGCTINTEISITDLSFDESILESSYDITDFNINDFFLTVTLSDGSTKYIEITELMLSATDLEKLNEAGTHTIEIQYQGYTIPITITLSASVEQSDETDRLFLAQAIEKLLNKSYLPSEYQSYIGVQSQYSASTFKKVSHTYAENETPIDNAIYEDEFAYNVFSSTGYNMQFLMMFQEKTDAFKQTLNVLITQIKSFGIYQKDEESGVYFKLIKGNSDSLDSLHFYVIDFNLQTFTYMHSYVYEGQEVFEVSITEPNASNQFESLLKTTTFQNIDDKIIRILLMFEVMHVGLESFGKFVIPQMYELHVNDEDNFELLTLSINSTLYTDQDNNVISIERDNVMVTRTSVSNNISITTQLTNRSDLLGRYTIEYYPDKNDASNFFYMNFDASDFVNMYASLKLFKNFNYVTYESTYINGYETKIATSLVTDEGSINFESEEKPYLNYGKMFVKVDGTYQYLDRYQMQFGNIYFESVEAMFDAIRPLELTYDIESLFNNREQLNENIRQTTMLNVNYFSMDYRQWLQYLDFNYFILTNPAQEAYDIKTSDQDLIKPFIIGPYSMTMAEFNDLDEASYASLVHAKDDIDGEISLDRNNVSILYMDDQPTALLYTVKDTAGNTAQFVINIIKS